MAPCIGVQLIRPNLDEKLQATDQDFCKLCTDFVDTLHWIWSRNSFLFGCSASSLGGTSRIEGNSSKISRVAVRS